MWPDVPCLMMVVSYNSLIETKNMKLSLALKTEYRKFLLDNGIRPRGMSDEQISDKVAEIKAGKNPEESKRDKPSKPKAPKPFKQPEGLPSQDGKSEISKDEAEQNVKNGDLIMQGQPAVGAIAGSIEKIIQDALNAGAPQIDESKIIELIQKHSQAPTRIEYEITVKRPDDMPDVKIAKAHPMLKKVVDCGKLGINVFLAGPAGCGKTYLAKQAADALGFEFFFTGAVSDAFELKGFIDANGTFHESSFYKALKAIERGAIGACFLFDEGDASVPTAMVAINAAIANGYMNFANETVYFDPKKLFFILAANTLGRGGNREYVGRYPLDGSTLNRFKRMHMKYDTGVEMNMAETAWLEAGGSTDQVSIAIDYCHEVIAFRRQLEDKGIKGILISPRQTQTGAALLAAGWPLDEVRQELYIDLNVDQCKTLGVKQHD